MIELDTIEIHMSAIGRVTSIDGQPCIQVFEAYTKALLHLDKFSHCLYFIVKNGQVLHRVAEMACVSVEQGYVFLDRTLEGEGEEVFDIKPYFPNEDRVKYYDGRCRIVGPNKNNPSKRSSAKVVNEASEGYSLKSTAKFTMVKDKQFLMLEKDRGLGKSLEDHPYLRVYWWFDRFDKAQYRRSLDCNPPYEHAPKSGIFATRSPVRPNPLASTVVKVLEYDEDAARIEVSGFDGFDHSYIIGIVAYQPEKELVQTYDLPEWLKHWPRWKSFRAYDYIDPDIDLLISGADWLRSRLDHSPDGHMNEKQHKTVVKNDHKHIKVINANQNNLKSVSVDIPKNAITVITGVSGSGKSSLAFDTIFTESQRQFMDVSGVDRNASYDKADVESVTGLQPSIAVEQKSLSNNPRSTVGTITGVVDYLRMLYSTIGTRHCPECKAPIKQLSKQEMKHLLLSLSQGVEVVLGQSRGMEEAVSGIVGQETFEDFIEASLERILEATQGIVYIKIDDSDVYALQTKAYCYECDRVFFDLTPSTFSFNNPEHMCPRCGGLGEEMRIDESRVIAQPSLSILDGAIPVLGNMRKHALKPNANWMRGEVLALAYDLKVDLELPYEALPDVYKKELLYGSDGRIVALEYDARGRSGLIERPAEGLMVYLGKRLDSINSDSKAMLKAVEDLMNISQCSLCHGERLLDEGRMVQIAGVRYPIAAAMSIEALQSWLHQLRHKLPKSELERVKDVIDKLVELLQKVIDVGLPYLTLDRGIPTLSGGEGQRIRLASQFGTNLTNILYVMDEPSMGLHPHDYRFLIDRIEELRAKDNTIVMVEHKKEMIEMADYIIDVGPGAGMYGGQVIAQGSVEAIKSNIDAITGPYLIGLEANSLKQDISSNRNSNSNGSISSTSTKGFIEIKGAKENNLKDIDVRIPLNQFVCVTGVSGSGKSSLISRTLAPKVKENLGLKADYIGTCDAVNGLGQIKGLIEVTQQAIGRTPRSNPATYTGVFDMIRDFYGALPQAKKLKLSKEHFSFNSKKGQCPECKGAGKIETKLNFMANIWTTCHVCGGSRYQEKVLEVKHRGYSISEILALEIVEVFEVFEEVPKIANYLGIINDVGLGYLKLGQSATTLSGGEAQRLKLATQLCKSKVKDTLYILDEPTTGLHYEDIKKLLLILESLVSKGDSVIVIEHHMDFIKEADYIIDLGPKGGDDGGELLAYGTPFEVSQHPSSITGQMLRKL